MLCSRAVSLALALIQRRISSICLRSASARRRAGHYRFGALLAVMIAPFHVSRGRPDGGKMAAQILLGIGFDDQSGAGRAVRFIRSMAGVALIRQDGPHVTRCGLLASAF